MYDRGTMEWFKHIIPMRDARNLDNKEYLVITDATEVQREEDNLGLDWLECYAAAPIFDVKYEIAKIDNVVVNKNKNILVDRSNMT